MGLIRKTLFLTAPGLVWPSAKKERTAKAANRLLAEQNALLREGNIQPEAERGREAYFSFNRAGWVAS